MCVEGTFESKSGNAPSIEVAKSGSHGFSTLATLNSGHKVIDIAHCDIVTAMTIPITRDSRLALDGEVTGYMPYNISPEETKAAFVLNQTSVKSSRPARFWC